MASSNSGTRRRRVLKAVWHTAFLPTREVYNAIDTAAATLRLLRPDWLLARAEEAAKEIASAEQRATEFERYEAKRLSRVNAKLDELNRVRISSGETILY